MAGVKHSELPWETVDADFGCGPVVIYFRPWSIEQRRQILAAKEKSLTDFAVESLVLRGRDETGQWIWRTKADRETIIHQYDPDELDRVVGVMYGVEDEPGN